MADVVDPLRSGWLGRHPVLYTLACRPGKSSQNLQLLTFYKVIHETNSKSV